MILLACMVKSEVAIASLLRQIQQTKNSLLEVKTITKLPGNGIAESVKSSNLHKKRERHNSLVYKLKNDFK